MHRSYRELSRLETFEERLEYLRLPGRVGEETFGFDRWINQQFYHSIEWDQARQYVLVRDNGCDLGVPGFDIPLSPLVHHINPIAMDDIVHADDTLLDPNNLITTSHKTHNAIHYGAKVLGLPTLPDRKPGDTKLW